MANNLPKNRDYRQSSYWQPKKTHKQFGDLVTCPVASCDGGLVFDYGKETKRACLFCNGKGWVHKSAEFGKVSVSKSGKPVGRPKICKLPKRHVGRPSGSAKKPKRCICGDTGLIRDIHTRKMRPCAACASKKFA